MSKDSSDDHDDDEDDGEPLSALYAFWCDADAPMEEEVRLAVQNALPGASLVDELERNDDLLWGHVWRTAEARSEIVVWAEERGDFNDELIRTGLTDADERDAALRARYLIGVETPHDRRRPLEGFRLQVRVLDAACVPGLTAVYDDNAVAVRSGRMMRALAASETPPRPAQLFAVHELDGPHGSWVHTHGLARLGVPELELWAVDESEKAEATELLTATVDAILGGAEPDEDRVLTVGDGVEVRLAGVDEALKHVSADVAASRRAHEDDDDGDHEEPRLCILAKDRFEPPYEVLDRLAEDVALFKSRDESERQRRLAVDRFGVFGQLFALRRRDGWRFLAKLGFPEDAAAEVREHLWFDVLELKPGRLRGTCLNAPVGTAKVREGDEDWFGLDLLTDWLVVAPQGNYDPEAATALLQDA